MPEIKLVQIDPKAKYLLFIQGLKPDRLEALLDILRKLAENEGQMGVIEFTPDIVWQFVKMEDLGAIASVQPLDNPLT